MFLEEFEDQEKRICLARTDLVITLLCPFGPDGPLPFSFYFDVISDLLKNGKNNTKNFYTPFIQITPNVNILPHLLPPALPLPFLRVSCIHDTPLPGNTSVCIS